MSIEQPTLQELAAKAAADFANGNVSRTAAQPAEQTIMDSIGMMDKIANQGPPPIPFQGQEDQFKVQTPQVSPEPQVHAIPAIQHIAQETRSAVPQVKMENYWEITGLPSTSEFYGGKKIMGRPLNVLEVKLLASINEGNVNHVINQVLSRVLRGINVDELLVADKLYIIFWLRANTYKDDGYKVEFDCLSCGKESDYEFNLNMLNITNIKEAYISVNEMTTPGGVRFKARYLTVQEENRVTDFLSNYNGVEELDEEILNLANMITEINGEKMTLLQKYTFFLSEKCTPQDYAYIESFVRHIDFGVDPIMQVKCTKCGGTSPVAISFRADFFVPQYSFK